MWKCGVFSNLWGQIILMLWISFFFFFFNFLPIIQRYSCGQKFTPAMKCSYSVRYGLKMPGFIHINTLTVFNAQKISSPLVPSCIGKNITLQLKSCQRWDKNASPWLFLWQFGHSCQSYVRASDKKIHIC